MKLSQCFAGSNGDLSCFSCHEIHNQPGPPHAWSTFARSAWNATRTRACELAPSRRPGNDCASCHMPKRDVAEISTRP